MIIMLTRKTLMSAHTHTKVSNSTDNALRPVTARYGQSNP